MTRYPVRILSVPLALLSACGGAGAGESAAVPERSGAVWTLDAPATRTTAPAAMLAFAHGLHTVVVDGSDVYAGTTRFRGTRDGAGSTVVDLGNGLTATLTPNGDTLDLVFSTGEQVALRKVVAP